MFAASKVFQRTRARKKLEKEKEKADKAEQKAEKDDKGEAKESKDGEAAGAQGSQASEEKEESTRSETHEAPSGQKQKLSERAQQLQLLSSFENFSLKSEGAAQNAADPELSQAAAFDVSSVFFHVWRFTVFQTLQIVAGVQSCTKQPKTWLGGTFADIYRSIVC